MIMMDTNRHSSNLGGSSATVTSSSSHFPLAQLGSEQYGTASPTSYRRPSGFSSRTPFAFSANSGSNNNNNNNNNNNSTRLSRGPSFSSTAAKFKYLSKYRARRLSQDSLTDLSPPTHPDLDLIPQPRSASSICIDEPLKSASPSSPNHRSSVIFLGRTAKPSLTRKPSKDTYSSSNMASSKAETTHHHSSSFSLRLRLLSNRTTNDSQATDSDKSPIHKHQPENTVTRSLKPSVLKSIQNKVTKAEVVVQQPTADSDEFEAIKSPTRNDFRNRTNPVSSHRPLSILNVSPTSRVPSTRELGRSSSSPNLNFTASTFSQRPSQESVSSQPSVNTFGSPKRSKPPPPIKVPLRGGSIAIAIGNDSSSATSSKIPTRHFHSNSESIGQSVRRFAGVHWSTSSNPKPTEPKTNNNASQTTHGILKVKSKTDSCEDLSAVTPSPRNVQIPISNCSLKANKDKFPVVMPLQPAPRRPSIPQLQQSSTDSKGRTLPLLISKHSRSLVNPTSPVKHRTSSECSSLNTSHLPDRVNNPRLSKRLPSTARLSHCPPSPRCDQPENQLQEKQSQVRRSLSSAGIPFPTSEEPVLDPITLSPNVVDYDHDCGLKRNQKEADPSSNLSRTSSGYTNTASVASFDIRSFPLRLDTTFESPVPVLSITIPKSIKIPQLQLGPKSHPPVITTGNSETLEVISKSRLMIMTEKKPSCELSSDSSPIRSGVSNSSGEALRSGLQIFTPSSLSPSNFSSSATSIAPSHNNVLMDFSRRKVKKMCRPRSMSECEPSRDDIWTRLFGNFKDLTSSPSSSPYSIDYPISVLPRLHSPRSAPIITQSIEQQVREKSPSELNKIVQDALNAYDPDTHRFIVGDINQIIQEAQRVEEKTKELHLRYLNAVRKREKFFEKQVLTLRALNPGLGESLFNAITQTDQLALELLESKEHSSKINRMCDAHWRAAATIQLKNLAVKEAQLEAAQSRVEQLESDRCRHAKEISELQSKLDLLQQDPGRPSSRANTDADSIGSGSVNSTNAPVVPGSPSSTPRITHFPFNSTQRPGKIVQSRMRLSSAQSYGSAFTSNSLMDTGLTDAVYTTASGEPASPRTAFLSSYGLAHSHALSSEQSETLSQPINKNEFRSLSSPKTDKPNSTSPNLPLNNFANFHRSESTGPARSTKLGGLILRPLFPNNNSIKQKRLINGNHLRGNRSSSFGPSDVRIVQESTPAPSLAPWEVKPRSSSSAMSTVPPAPQPASTWTHQNGGANYISDLSSSSSMETASNDVQQSNVTPRAASSSSLLRFPRQAPPPPTLPLPSTSASTSSSSEQCTRRRGEWNADGSANGNLSSITLSQLGSLDIANLINNLDSSEN